MLKLRIDTRETLPLSFRDGVFDEIEVKMLPFGDYGLWYDDIQVPIVFERKAFGDLFGSMSAGYERLKKRFLQAKEEGFFFFLLVEGSIEEVFTGSPGGVVKGAGIIKRLATIQVKYDVHTHFFNSRREMAFYIEQISLAVARSFKVVVHRKGKPSE